MDYIHQEPTVKPLYGNYPDIEGFGKQIQLKKFEHRQLLVERLRKQYEGLAEQPDLDILLDEKTFTVTTGHQLNIFTGPLYVIFKIVSTINLARQLKAAYPEYNFVPVYWMATEDHDWDEISYFNLFGKRYDWETDQTGMVGDMDPSAILDIIEELPEKPELFIKAYSENKTLGAAVRQYMNEMFGVHGLVCVDGDDAELKRTFIPVMKQDLLENTAKTELDKNAEVLQTLGFRPQVNGRDINLFYVAAGVRERIDKDGDDFVVVNTDLRFTEAEILKLMEESPEKFSPNVILRPMYQETILPNLAYLGGPSELIYWLQLKDAFEAMNTLYPIVMPRNFGMVINKGQQKRIDRLGIQASELYQNEAVLRKRFVADNSDHTLNFKEEKKAINTTFETIVKKTVEIDPTLKASVEAEKVKVLKQIGHLEARIKRAEEQKFETSINQLLRLKDQLFPGGGPHERVDNFLNYYINDSQFVDKLLDAFDPLDYSVNIISV